MKRSADLYERDFHAWALRQAEAVREGRFEEVDRGNVAEEIEALARSERRALKSQLERLMLHLLKWEHQPQERKRRQRGWLGSILDAREKIADILEESPSLRAQVPELLAKAYQSARRRAAVETGLSESKFRQNCPWTFEEATNPDFPRSSAA